MAATETVTPFPSRHHHIATTGLLVTFFWFIAAGLVLAAERLIGPRSGRAGAVAVVAALVLTAFAYTHLVAREAGIGHALDVGIAWLALSILAEIALSARTGHSWFTLLGSPARPLLRHVLLFAWIFAPSLFARRAPDSARSRHA